MKHLTIAAALLLGTSLSALADETILRDGCEIRPVPGQNYYNKVDPRCSFGTGNDGGAIGFTPISLPPVDNGGSSEEPKEPVDPEEPCKKCAPIDPEEPVDPPTDPVDPPSEPVDPEPPVGCKSCAPETE